MKLIVLILIIAVIISIIRSNSHSTKSKAGVTRSMNNIDKIYGFFIIIKLKIKNLLEK